MNLLKEERQRLIIEELEKNDRVFVEELAREFGVTTETIRRDLDQLDRESRLKKVHGGAVRVAYRSSEPSFSERVAQHLAGKEAIGRRAAALVQDGEIISIDSGTTTVQIIPFLVRCRNLTIVTPSFAVMERILALRDAPAWNIVFVGGGVNMQLRTTSGALAERMLDEFHTDKAFIAAGGITPEGGITDFGMDEAGFSRKLLDRSRSSYVMADESKIGVTNFRKIAELDEVSGIITNAAFPEKWRKTLRGRTVNWIVS